MKKIFKRMILITASTVAALALATVVFMQQASFGKLPSGARLERIQRSPNFKNGTFQNLSPTPDLTEGVSYWAVLKEFFFAKKERVTPDHALPSTKTDLLHLGPKENVLVWFGHSSYFMQIDGKIILVDPVFSGAASPVSFTTKSFKGTDRYSVVDIPDIDYLFLSHDHWDHVDYETLKQLQPRIGKVICGLGVGAHLEHWGFDTAKIQEKDWYDSVEMEAGFQAWATPARHFSGRGFSRNKSLWLSYVLQTPSFKIYIGGDSGFGSHFEEIGKKYGPFDLAILENGQYDKSWKYIHMMPNEVLQAAQDLKAERLFPVHSSKFALGNHSWDDPLKRITEYNKKIQLPLVTPIIGELVDLDNAEQAFIAWWEKAD
jgi:L-ascorbate metabolism protein UlaG (beta-lactamase superfamily)